MAWDPLDPFVTDPDGFVVGLKCAPPHHAELREAGWEGGKNLFPLVVDRPEAFSADVLIYTRTVNGSHKTKVTTLSEHRPYTYTLADS